MIERATIQELFKLPVDERRRVARLLQESLAESDESKPELDASDQPSPSAAWLLSMAGHYSGGPGNSAARADQILRTEVTQ